MKELSIEENDYLEGLIPHLAADATHAAYLRAVAAGYTLVMAKDGLLVRIGPDSSETPLRALRGKHTVGVGHVFPLRSLPRS